jgi:hypothetical protein
MQTNMSYLCRNFEDEICYPSLFKFTQFFPYFGLYWELWGKLWDNYYIPMVNYINLTYENMSSDIVYIMHCQKMFARKCR